MAGSNGNGRNGNGNPSVNGNGRDGHTGQFLPGNNCGKGGNPHATKVKELQAILYDATEPKDIEEVWEKLLELAKDGNLKAAKEVLDRLLGKPKETVEVQSDIVGAISAIRSGFHSIMKDEKFRKSLEERMLG